MLFSEVVQSYCHSVKVHTMCEQFVLQTHLYLEQLLVTFIVTHISHIVQVCLYNYRIIVHQCLQHLDKFN